MKNKQKFDEDLYKLFCDTFCYLPLAHVLNKEVFIVHGGLFSKDDVTLEDLQKEDRVGEPPDAGLMVWMFISSFACVAYSQS